MTFTPHIREVTLGEPIDDLEIHQDDQFYLGLNIYDDQGNVWPDGYTCNIYIYVSRKDLYSGSGSYLDHFSGTATSGTGTVFFSGASLQTPGDYQAEIVLTSGTGSAGIEVTAGEFRFNVMSD